MEKWNSMDLNDTVTVTLTNRGAEILNRRARRSNKYFKTIISKDDYREGDNYTASLWTMFEDLGGERCAGSEAVFTNLRKKQ